MVKRLASAKQASRVCYLSMASKSHLYHSNVEFKITPKVQLGGQKEGRHKVDKFNRVTLDNTVCFVLGGVVGVRPSFVHVPLIRRLV
jgi:hypothetical protein